MSHASFRLPPPAAHLTHQHRADSWAKRGASAARPPTASNQGGRIHRGFIMLKHYCFVATDPFAGRDRYIGVKLVFASSKPANVLRTYEADWPPAPGSVFLCVWCVWRCVRVSVCSGLGCVWPGRIAFLIFDGYSQRLPQPCSHSLDSLHPAHSVDSDDSVVVVSVSHLRHLLPAGSDDS